MARAGPPPNLCAKFGARSPDMVWRQIVEKLLVGLDDRRAEWWRSLLELDWPHVCVLLKAKEADCVITVTVGNRLGSTFSPFPAPPPSPPPRITRIPANFGAGFGGVGPGPGGTWAGDGPNDLFSHFPGDCHGDR